MVNNSEEQLYLQQVQQGCESAKILFTASQVYFEHKVGVRQGHAEKRLSSSHILSRCVVVYFLCGIISLCKVCHVLFIIYRFMLNYAIHSYLSGLRNFEVSFCLEVTRHHLEDLNYCLRYSWI